MKRLFKIYLKGNIFLILLMALGALGVVYSNFMRANLLNALVDSNRTEFVQASIGLFGSYLVF